MKWIGPNPSWVAVYTTTTTNAQGKPTNVPIYKGVEASKNNDGSLDILLSPAVIGKLEGVFKKVTPCGARRVRKRAGPACGLAHFVEEVGADPELGKTFSQPLNDQASLEELSCTAILADCP
jgi:hypothetical protein